MAKRRWLWGILLVLLAVVPVGRPVERVAAQGGGAADILALVNQLRASYGLPPYVWDGSLAAAAQNQANYMATNNIYSHSGAGGSTPQSRAIAAGYPGRATENIVGGTALTPSQGFTWWRNSATHFNTMISQQYIHAGVGFAQGHDQNFYALVVGVPSDEPGAIAPAPLPGDETLAPVAPIQLAAPREDGSIVHVVGPGHSFWAIAARYEVPLEQIYLFNNLTEDSVINPGDELIIRLAEGQEPPPTPTPPASHVVQEGDSLWTIAAWYKLSLDDLLWLNSMQEDSLVQPGDEVRIRLLPGEEPPPTATPQLAHIVQDGDTAWGIAVRYGLALDELLAFNGMSGNPVLSIGDSLLIVAPTPFPTATPEYTATPLASAVPTVAITSTPATSRVALASAVTPTSEAPPSAKPSAEAAPSLPTFGTALLFAAGVLLFLGAAFIGILRLQK